VRLNAIGLWTRKLQPGLLGARTLLPDSDQFAAVRFINYFVWKTIAFKSRHISGKCGAGVCFQSAENQTAGKIPRDKTRSNQAMPSRYLSAEGAELIDRQAAENSRSDMPSDSAPDEGAEPTQVAESPAVLVNVKSVEAR